jgi:hypothetical protein
MSQVTLRSACTAQRNDGSFCDAPSLPDAPFPICMKHAAKVLEFLQVSAETMTAVRGGAVSAGRLDSSRAALARRRREVVYYAALDSLIKIGTTNDLAARLRQYPPTTVLLGLELGGRDTEDVRLRQFADHLASGREWFRRCPELERHIAALPPVAEFPEFEGTDMAPPDLHDGAFVTTAQAASLVGIQDATIRNWVWRGLLKPSYIDGQGRSLFWAGDVLEVESRTKLRRNRATRATA